MPGPPTPHNKPPWVQPRIKAAPKIRQIYWCDYWKDARLPEMWKTRPVIIVSYKNTLTGPCLVVPVSTEPQDNNPWAHRLSIEIEGAGNGCPLPPARGESLARGAVRLPLVFCASGQTLSCGLRRRVAQVLTAFL